MNWHEVAIISYLLDKKELIPQIRDEIFTDPKAKDIFEVVKDNHFKEKLITTRELSLLMGKEYDKYLSRLRKFIREPPDEALVLRLIANKIVKEALVDIAPEIGRLEVEDFSELKKAIEVAEALPSKNRGETMEEFAQEVDDYFDFLDLQKYPTFLNNVYIYPGEVGIVQASPKGGKTTGLVNLACLYLVHGFNVYFWELERPKHEMFARIALRLTGKPDFKLASKRIKLFGSQLYLKCDPSCTMMEIRRWLNSGRPNVCIIDYADYVKGSKHKEERFKIRDILLFFRETAKKLDIPFWTASQSGMKGVSKAKKGHYQDIEDLEEAKVAKAGIASLIIGLNQTEEEKEDQICRANIVVSTHGYGGRRICELDFKRQLMKEIKSGGE